MEQKSKGNFECPNCHGELTISTILNCYKNVWLNEKLFSFSCPNCLNYSICHIDNNTMEIGVATIDSFTCFSEIYDSELFVELMRDRMIVDYKHDIYIIMAKGDDAQ